MGSPEKRTACASRQSRSSCHGPIETLGLSFLLLLSGCAQFDRFLGDVKGKGFGSAESSSPTALEQGNAQTQPQDPGTKPVAKTSDEPQPEKLQSESRPQQPEAAQAQPAVPAAGAPKEPEPEIKRPEPDKALAEKDHAPKEKRPHAASTKKSKKPAASKPSTEDAFLPPVPLPSKPPAIGGSGG